MFPLLVQAALSAAPVTGASPAAASPASGSSSVVLPGLVLLVLAVAAFVVSRRKASAGGRIVQVMDSASLGPRRSVAVVRVGADALVLAVSESGVALLATRPAAELDRFTAPGAARAPADGDALRTAAADADHGAPARSEPRGPLPPTRFDALLAETVEQQELRRKLRQGDIGRAR